MYPEHVSSNRKILNVCVIKQGILNTLLCIHGYINFSNISRWKIVNFEKSGHLNTLKCSMSQNGIYK